MAAAGWEHFPHDADVGVRGYGATPAEAFAQAAVAMIAIVTEPDHVRPSTSVKIECVAPNLETLLVDWLNRIVFEMATRKIIFGCFTVKIKDQRLIGTAHGEPIDVDRHQPAAEIKGATFTALSVAKELSGCWHAQCVLDV